MQTLEPVHDFWVMDPVWTNLVSGLVGAVAGGVLALLGSIKATKDLISHERVMDEDRELRLHQAAVRAVVVELTSNSVALSAMMESSLKAQHAKVDTSAYDALLVPLYSRMAGETLAPVARAYIRLHIFKDKPIIIATEHEGYVTDGLNALLRYALQDLGLDLSVPDETKR